MAVRSFAGDDGGSATRSETTRTNGDASATEGAEARKTTRTRKRWRRNARRTCPRSRTPWSRWWREHRRFLEIRARATTLWEKRSAGAMRETRARSGHRPERSERATAPRVSPRVLLRACGAPASPGASACASRDPTTHARDFKKTPRRVEIALGANKRLSRNRR